MKPTRIHRIVSTAMLGFAALASPAYAQTSGVAAEAASMDDIAGTVGGARVEQRISADFSAFAGSESNARSLVTGLRSGGVITLTSAGGASTSASGTGGGSAGASGLAQGAGTVTITPPTRPMGYGNIYLALSLAKQQLAAQGITNPTPQQLQLALMGGTVISGNPPQTQTVQGVLQLRSQGMGWGQIANNYGVKLGSVVGSMKSANQRLSGMTPTTPAASSGTASATAAIATGTGIRNAAGVPAQAGGAEFGFHGRGIVSAGGGDGNVNAYGSAHAGGIASAHGAPVTAIGRTANPGAVRGILH